MLKTMKKIVIDSRKNFDRIQAGHPWIYRSQIKFADSGIDPEEPVGVYTDRKKWVGAGWLNLQSVISLRMLTREEEPIDTAFFERKIKQAIAWRRTYLPASTSLRWVNSESDGLPGLIVDQYQDHLVIQITTLGMESQKSVIVKILKNLLQPKGIYERNDFPSRNFEGLPLLKGSLDGDHPPDLLEIEENEARFWVDVVNGHKTGFYLDQRENRKRAGELAKGREVLDCFAYTGGFSVTALRGGAKNVLTLEASEETLKLAEKNMILNHVQEHWQGLLGNGFDLLKQFSLEEKKFDMIILDPPSFTKKKEALERALAGYKEINLRAIKMLREGGILVSASCSHHIQEPLFLDVLIDAAKDAKRMLRLIHRGTQGLDHPIVPVIPETQYLKCFFFEVHSLH